MTLRTFVAGAALAVGLALPASASADFGFLGEFGPSGQAVDVDPAGNVWVVNLTDRQVRKTTADGQPITAISSEQFGYNGVAVDGAGNVYVNHEGVGQILRYS